MKADFFPEFEKCTKKENTLELMYDYQLFLIFKVLKKEYSSNLTKLSFVIYIFNMLINNKKEVFF